LRPSSPSPVRDELAPTVARIGRRPGDEPVEVVLDDDAAAQVLGEDRGDPGQAGPEEDLFGQALLDAQGPGHLVVRLGQGSGQPDLVLVPTGVIDGDGGMAREGREDVRGTAREPAPAGMGVHVDRADGVASDDQRGAEDRTEVVDVERSGAMLVVPVVRHLDGVPGPDRLARHAFAEPQHEPEHLRGEVPDRHDPEDILVAIPEEHVPAVRAEERGRVVDDRREHGLEIQRLGDLPGGGKQTVELRRATLVLVEEDGAGEVERDRLEAGDRQVVERATRDRDAHPPSIAGSECRRRPGIGGRRSGRRAAARRHPSNDSRFAGSSRVP
jgi:hypothetical protein